LSIHPFVLVNLGENYFASAQPHQINESDLTPTLKIVTQTNSYRNYNQHNVRSPDGEVETPESSGRSSEASYRASFKILYLLPKASYRVSNILLLRGILASCAVSFPKDLISVRDMAKQPSSFRRPVEIQNC